MSTNNTINSRNRDEESFIVAVWVRGMIGADHRHHNGSTAIISEFEIRMRGNKYPKQWYNGRSPLLPPTRAKNSQCVAGSLPDLTSVVPSDLLSRERLHRGRITPEAEAHRRYRIFGFVSIILVPHPETVQIMSDPTSGSIHPVPESPVYHCLMLVGVQEKLTQPQVLSKTNGSPGDVENTISEVDPFSFRGGLKTDEELMVLRRRKKGKPLENYHRKQNEVRSSFPRTAHL